MKKVFISIGFSILFTGFLSFNSRAQQAAPPLNFVVFEEMVSPADMPAFAKTQQQAVDLWKKHGLNVPIYCYGTENNVFYWVIPIKNFGSIDTLFEKFSGVTKKMKEADGYDGSKEFRDLSTTRSSVIRWAPELSYHPDGKFGQTPDKPYAEWTFCSIRSGHEKEAGDAIKKYIEFYRKTGEVYEWDIYHVDFGYDTPMMILMTLSENPVAIRQREAATWEKHSQEFMDLWNNFTSHVRKIEKNTGWYRPEWSINTVK
jgi:hypothetical protein